MHFSFSSEKIEAVSYVMVRSAKYERWMIIFVKYS